MKYLIERLLFLENYIESYNSTFTHNKDTYRVNDLIKLSKNYDIKEYNVSDLEWIFKYSKVGTNRKLKPDLRYPILITTYGNKLVVIDGLHRLYKAKEENISKIKGIYIPEKDINKLPKVDKKTKNYISENTSNDTSKIFIFGENHFNKNDVKRIQTHIIKLKPSIIISELYWEDETFYKKYLPTTKVIPLEPDRKYKNMSFNDSFKIREKYMLENIKKYSNQKGIICVIVGDAHLRSIKTEEFSTISPIYEWSKYNRNVKIIRSDKPEIDKEIYAYHYFANIDTANKIIESGKLKSLSVLDINHPEREKYKGRPWGDMDDPTLYNQKYKSVIKKEFFTHGIYFTTVDLFTFPNKMIGRIKIPIKYLLKYGDVTFEHGPKSKVYNGVILVKNENDIRNEVTKYPTDGKKLSKLYFAKNKIYLFENLPQIVLWSNYLPIRKDMIELRTLVK